MASVTNHLPIWGPASGQAADTLSTPFLGPSTMEGEQSDLPHPSPRLSLNPRGRKARASDNANPDAHARNTLGKSSSGTNMGFNPDSYGNPKAKRTEGDGQSQIDVHPGWTLPAPRPVSQRSSWISCNSTQSGVKIQGENTVVQQDRNQETTYSNVESTETQSCATNLEVVHCTPTRLASSITTPVSATPVTIQIPGFDKKAYGDPSRRKSTQTATLSTKWRQPNVSPAPEARQESKGALKTQVNSNHEKADPQPFTPLPYSQSPPSHSLINSFINNDKAFENNTLRINVDSDHKQHTKTTSSRNDAAKKSDSGPHPATFETLKEGNETPEQVIARLQAAGSREVHQRIQRKDQGEIPTTTALALLDLLRKPLPLDSVEPRPSATDIRARALSNLDPNLSRDQFLRGAVGSTNRNLTESKKERKEKRRWKNDKLNPTLWQDTAVQLDNGDSGGKDIAAPSVNNVGAKVEIASQSYKDAVASSEHDSQSYCGHGWASKQKVNNPGPMRTRWAKGAELKAPPVKPDSNAEGSEEPESDNDSTRPMARGFGRLIRSRKPAVPEEKLVGWDGQFQPPPTDWEHRPQFYNNTPEYISGFDGWLGEVAVRTMSDKSSPNINFGVLPLEEVANLDNHADGIGFAPREMMLDPSNSERYGHRLVRALKADPHNPTDFDGDAKLDLSDPENARYKDETAEMFIARRMAHFEREQKETEARVKLQQELERKEAAAMAADEIAAQKQEMARPSSPITSKNIYLRPAVEVDAPGMMSILNWHIANGNRPSELADISEDDMVERLKMSQQARLPFIVAVERTRKTAHSRTRKSPRVNPNHPIQNIDPNYIGVTRDEPIVGWASATDWSACDYIETITAEVEVYVAASHRKSGVGRCLMDALLDATDRGYMKKGGYEFRVAPEMKHMYTGGGGRDLHKLIFQVRSFNKPMTPEQVERIHRAAIRKSDPALNPARGGGNRRNKKPNEKTTGDEETSSKKDFSKEAKLDDREDDYEIWLKDWLESHGFEEEALLKKLGTKKGRFVDVRYLSRETFWQPTDHRLPDYTHGI